MTRSTPALSFNRPMLRALLIDDEPLACDILRALLAEHTAFAVVGEAGTVDEAVARLAVGDYDLVFLDIQLRGGNGFDLVPHVRVGARIIFVTAYDAYALRAFEVNALDYLLKPIAPERLTRALGRLDALPGAEPEPAAAPASIALLTADDRLLLKLGAGNERFVRLADIRLIASCENYSEITLGDGAHFLVRKTMKAWEDQLPPGRFVRVHRTAIINLDHVVQLERETNSVSLLHLAGVDRPITVSHRYLEDLRESIASRGR